MKALVVDEDKKLIFAEYELPEISPDECLVKVHAIGVNRADLLQKEGKYPPPAGESAILGLEFSGEIVQCGSQVTDWQVNDKVFALVAGGAYAEYVKVKASLLLKLPASCTFEQGAAIAEVFLTAYQSLFSIANLQSHSHVLPKVLIHAGASGVGTAAIELAKAQNCFVVATVGSDEKRLACQKLGADVVLNYHHSDFQRWTKENLPEGFDIILDVVAGPYVNKNIACAALDAHIVILSLLGGRFTDPIDVAKLLAKRITLSASTLRNRDNAYKTALVNDFKQAFMPLFAKGDLLPIIDSVYSWEEVDKAHAKMAANKNIGKIILHLQK